MPPGIMQRDLKAMHELIDFKSLGIYMIKFVGRVSFAAIAFLATFFFFKFLMWFRYGAADVDANTLIFLATGIAAIILFNFWLKTIRFMGEELK